MGLLAQQQSYMGYSANRRWSWPLASILQPIVYFVIGLAEHHGAAC